MSQIWLTKEIFCSLRSQTISLVSHSIKTIALTNNYCTQNFGCPIGVVWLHAWLCPKNVFFSSGAAFLSLAPSSAKGYYATTHKSRAFNFVTCIACLESDASDV